MKIIRKNIEKERSSKQILFSSAGRHGDARPVLTSWVRQNSVKREISMTEVGVFWRPFVCMHVVCDALGGELSFPPSPACLPCFFPLVESSHAEDWVFRVALIGGAAAPGSCIRCLRDARREKAEAKVGVGSFCGTLSVLPREM